MLRRYLADRGQSIIAEHFELSLTLGEAIVDSVYGEAEPTSPGQLFLVLNTESSCAMGLGQAITELETAQAGMGQAFYDALRQALYHWIRVYRQKQRQRTLGEGSPQYRDVGEFSSETVPSSIF